MDLASSGLGTTYPNPLVGSVIVHQDKIIGEGFHKKAGESHAEVFAIQSVKDKEKLKNSTIYVSLEPCSHFGRTPPCADLIIQHQIPKVVIGMKDPFTKVNGQGIKKLQDVGIEVIESVMQEECKEINKRFITFHEKKRPYIFLKFAKSFDGFLSSFHHQDNTPLYLTNEHSLQYVHYRRTQEQAILIGKNTAIQDNPKLDCRKVDAEDSLIKIVIDPNLETLNHQLNLLNSHSKVLIFNHIKDLKTEHYECIKIDKTNFLEHLLKKLHQREIQSLIVEGGSFTLNEFISQNLWDEAEIYSSDVILSKGVEVPKITGKIIHQTHFQENQFTVLKNNLDCN